MSYFSPPVENFKWKWNTSQLFGVNAAGYRQFSNDYGEPIPGHNGHDIVFPGAEKMGYGQNILAVADGVVSQRVHDNEIRTRGNGLYILHDILPDGKRYESVYWHISEFLVQSGERVQKGQVIAKCGNTGYVLPKPSPGCPFCGSHLHFAVRLYINNKLVRTEYGSGYMDTTPLLYNQGDKLPMLFASDLSVTSTGDQVSWLQTILKLEGFAEDYNPIGYFGRKTLRDVIKLQLKHGINPPLGYVGQKTRAYLNSHYS